VIVTKPKVKVGSIDSVFLGKDQAPGRALAKLKKERWRRGEKRFLG